MKKVRYDYIDNLRVMLMVLVILHHSFITYGAPGGWYYIEATKKLGALIPMTLFVATNQSFFMGFFFFLSALFIEPSIKRKGIKLFIADRLKRLGIPLVFYSLILSPVLSWMVTRFGEGNKISFWNYLSFYHHWVNFGVLWFVAALLLFTLLYTLVRPFLPSQTNEPRPVPGNSRILLFALGLGLLSFMVRIFFPLGWILQPLGFQLAHFSQYIALFILGIVAFRNQWPEKFNIPQARPFLRIAGIMMSVIFPLLYLIMVVSGSSIEAFSGNGTYQSFLSATWEQITGISIMVVLLGYGREKGNQQSTLLRNMSRSAFAAYIFHPLVVVSLALSCRSISIDPALKLLFVGPLAVVFSFLLGALLVKIPGVNKII